MVMSFAIVSFIAVASLIYFYFKSVNGYWKSRNVTGPKPIPFFGNIIDSAIRRKHVAVLFKKFYNDFPNEKYVGFYRMTTPSLLIRDLDIVRQILIKDFEAFPDRGIEYSKEGLGDNLFHCDSVTWRALRPHMTPLFTSEKLKKMVNLLRQQSHKFIEHVEIISSDQMEHPMINLFQKYCMASIMVCFFDISVDTYGDKTGVFEKLDRSMITVPHVNEIELLIPGILKKANVSLFNKIAIRYCYKIIEAVRLHRSDKPSIVNDVMDILFALEHQDQTKSPKKCNNDKDSFKITEDVMAGQVFIFFAAGYANNTNVLSYTMYHLAKNPDIQNKLIAEIDDVLRKFNGEITYESVNAMTYLDRVFSETLRMHPIANSLQRSAARSYDLPGSDLRIEKGMSIVISPMAIHHDPLLYPNPDKFDPERFLPEIAKTRHSCAYLPFGIGPRSCIATRFAKLQYKVCVAEFLSRFRVEPSRRTKDEYFINPHRSLLGPAGEIYLNITPRTK